MKNKCSKNHINLSSEDSHCLKHYKYLKKYFFICTVTLSFGHKPYFTFQFKGPNYDYKRLDLLEIGLYAWYDIDVENKLDFFKSDHIYQNYDNVQEVNLLNVACGHE